MRVLLALLATVSPGACSNTAPPTAAPPSAPLATPTSSPVPIVPSASLTVVATVDAYCGAIGGCQYAADLAGPGGTWHVAFEWPRGGDYELIVTRGLPSVLAAGDYRLTLTSRVVSDAVMNGVREIGPVDATCGVDFNVAEGGPPLMAAGIFTADACTVVVGPGLSRTIPLFVDGMVTGRDKSLTVEELLELGG